MDDFTGAQRDLLPVIAGLDDPPGRAVQTELEPSYRAEIDPGRLYPTIDTLVEKGRLDDRTTSDTLTRRGKREILARRELGAAVYRSDGDL